MSFNFNSNSFNTEKYDKYLKDFDFSKVDYTQSTNKDISLFDGGYKSGNENFAGSDDVSIFGDFE